MAEERELLERRRSAIKKRGKKSSKWLLKALLILALLVMLPASCGALYDVTYRLVSCLWIVIYAGVIFGALNLFIGFFGGHE